METKSAKGSSVLLFGLSFNLILTLASLGFTCYSLNRFESRLTAVEQDLLATYSPYRGADSVNVKTTSIRSPLNGSQKKNNVAKRAVDNPCMCNKCSRACLNLNVDRSVSCSLFMAFIYILCDYFRFQDINRQFQDFWWVFLLLRYLTNTLTKLILLCK